MNRWRRWLGPTLAVALLTLAIAAIHRELGPFSYKQLSDQLDAVPARQIAIALLWAGLSYLALTLQEFLAVRSQGMRLRYSQVAQASFCAYAFSHTIGLVSITGSSVRYRFYSSWGFNAVEVAKAIALTAASFWLGFLALASVAFLWTPPSAANRSWMAWISPRLLGTLFLLLLGGYFTLVMVFRGRRTLHIRGHEFQFPSPAASALQLGLSVVDWGSSAATFYALLPGEFRSSFTHFLAVFLFAQFVGSSSQVPGGLGIFESVVLVLLGSTQQTTELAAALVLYRLIYYLLPLVLSAILFASFELRSRYPVVARAPRAVAGALIGAAPPFFAVLVFASGLVLLVSGATPAETSRLAWIRNVVPLPFVEASHMLASLTGAALLLLARGLQLRLDAAYLLTTLLLGAGAVFSLVKGFDYEEALLLGTVLIALLPARKQFYRRARLLGETFTPGWIAAVTAALLASGFITYFAHKHLDWSEDLWWRFSFHAEAPRSVRAIAAVVIAVGLVGLFRLLRPIRPTEQLPDAEALDSAQRVVEQSRSTVAALALLGDKSLLFNRERSAFVMYARVGRSFVALHDPVGSEDQVEELAWQFRELADRHGGWTVFYEVSSERLPLYLDLGLSLIKLGEEGRVSLQQFSLEGAGGKSWRHTLNTQHRDGSMFAVHGAADVDVLLPELRRVSDAWLAERNTREKGFSLGYFDEQYVRRLPVAVVRRHGEIVAFANLWTGADHEELSIDLMRYLPSAPKATMDYLFLEIMVWGREQGYRWFNLGMAPFSGLESRRHAPLWSKVGSYLFRHGEHFYNFQGLRQFKEKFHPVWAPRYLAYPGGMTLPRVLIDIASLTSGGIKGALTK